MTKLTLECTSPNGNVVNIDYELDSFLPNFEAGTSVRDQMRSAYSALTIQIQNYPWALIDADGQFALLNMSQFRAIEITDFDIPESD